MHYYLYSYFSLGIVSRDRTFDISLFDDPRDFNRIIYDLMEEIWKEVTRNSNLPDDVFDDTAEYYDLEVEIYSRFLSECWNSAKLETREDVIGVLIESTGAGRDYSLDENMPMNELDPTHSLHPDNYK